MTFQSLRTNFSDSSWLKIPQELIQHQGRLILSKNESRSLLQEARKAIDDDCLRDAQNALYAGLLLDEIQFLNDIQKSGCLRISRRSCIAEPHTAIVSSLLDPNLGLSSKVRDYLQSVRTLYHVAESVRIEYEELRDWLAEERERGIRGLLGTLDFLFLNRTLQQHCWSDPSRPSRAPFFFSVEQLADGLSSILALYFNEFGALCGNVIIDAAAAVEGEYLDYLIAGAHLAEFRAWEFLLDRFGFHMIGDLSTKQFRLLPGSEDQHRAIEYGYIQDGVQRTSHSYLWHNYEAKSIVEIGGRFAEMCLSFIDEPRPRYRLEFPEIMFEMVGSIGELTQEEQKSISWACEEMSISPEELFAFEFGNGVTIDDLFRIWRVVSFMRGVAASKLLEEVEERPEVVFNSLVPAIRRSQLLDMFGKVIGHDKAQHVADLLSASTEGHVDVLYTPLIPAGDSVLLPVHVFSQSNIFRNPLILTQRRLFPDGTFDPLTNQVAQSFEKAGAEVLKNVPYSLNGESGECDVIAFMEDYCFVIECKNSLLPTGVHELRTSLDHIETAADQLKRFASCFQDSDFRDWFSRHLGREIPDQIKLLPAIIISNRMFLGMRPHGIPVRGNHEFAQFVESGTIELRDTGVIEKSSSEVRFWCGESMSLEDLIRYFEDDITYVPHWDAMEEFVSRFEFSNCCVNVPRKRMNVIALVGNLGFRELKQKLIARAKADGVPIDDNGWHLSEIVSEGDHDESLRGREGQDDV